MEMNNNICRLCLLDDASVNIFEKKKSNVLDMIQRTCHIEVLEEGSLPRKVCLKCLDTLEICDKFIIQVIENDKILKDAIEVKTKTKTTVKTEDKYSDDNNTILDTDNNFDYASCNDYNFEEVDIKYDPESDQENDEYTIDKKEVETPEVKTKAIKKERDVVKKISHKSIKPESCEKYVPKRSYKKRFRFKDYVCDYCTKSFNKRINIMRHIRCVHGTKTVVCTICHDTLPNRYSLRVHHAAEHPNQRMKRKRNRNRLKEYKKFFCDLCGKYIIKLKAHKMRVHNTELNYCCEFCPKKFKVRSCLTKHISNMHKDSRVICDMCNKTYCNKTILKAHILSVHTGQTYRCELCDKVYKNILTYNVHKRRHVSKKLYKCKYCEKPFNFSGARAQHERIHTGVTPYKCPSCPRVFTQLSNMKGHFKNNHKDIVFRDVYKPAARGKKSYERTYIGSESNNTSADVKNEEAMK